MKVRVKFLSEDKKIGNIKFIRAITGLGLKESKDLFEEDKDFYVLESTSSTLTTSQQIKEFALNDCGIRIQIINPEPLFSGTFEMTEDDTMLLTVELDERNKLTVETEQDNFYKVIGSFKEMVKECI